MRGMVRPVGGVPAKIDAAVRAGVKKVFIPKANYKDYFEGLPLKVVPVAKVEEMLEEVFRSRALLFASAGSLVSKVNG